jgi:hypothetical protein
MHLISNTLAIISAIPDLQLAINEEIRSKNYKNIKITNQSFPFRERER